MMKITHETHNTPTADRRKIRFIVLSMLIVSLGGLFTLFWQEQQHQATLAADSNVVGPPSLPAATVDSILSSKGSPMAGTGSVVEAASSRFHIDDAFALGVWWAETNDGEAGVGAGYHNPGGVQASPTYGGSGYTNYPSYAAAENDWFSILQGRYISQGLTTVYSISGPYVGTSGAPTWANKVMNYMTSYRAMAPAPTPQPTPQPTPTPTPTPQPTPQPTPIPTAVVKPKTNTHKNSTPVNNGQQQLSTQLPLIGTGLMVAALLAVPGLLIRRKRQATAQPQVGTAMPALPFQLEQATNSLPVTTRLEMEAISAQQTNPVSMNEYSSVLEREMVNTVNTNQLAFEDNMLPPIPASPSFIEPILEPVTVGDGTGAVPPTPLQRVPATPLFRGIPATPLQSHSLQGGLLTRYKMQSRPHRIELTHATNPHKIVNHYGGEREPDPHTETLHWE